ncbi:nitrilase-related carbon-nitrogen hydrolase [Roseovarius salis]|uniref:carbon-nitrogen hydrolase family protein n=1 Tax=Roseovarius salis TaxID=3376063 RepID=UPI0037CAACD9
MKAALLQLSSGDDPGVNLADVSAHFDTAVEMGAGFVLTPEVTNCVSMSRARQREVLCHQRDDPTLAALRDKARAAGIWCLVGSLALKSDARDGRLVNRSFLIAPDGTVAAWYDKIHMFDVELSETETYRESDGYRPGERAVVAGTPFGALGLSVCYDLRFPHLYRALARAGAEILTVPSAFSVPTGRAHWEVLLRARAIETGSYVLAPAQTGTHAAIRGKQRQTYGHSLAVGPWGDILKDAGTSTGVICVDLDRRQVEDARRRIPALRQARRFEGPA